MPNFFDALQRLEFLLGASRINVFGVNVAVNKLDCLEEFAWGKAFPNLAESARAERFDQAVSRDRFGARLTEPTHARSYSPGSIRPRNRLPAHEMDRSGAVPPTSHGATSCAAEHSACSRKKLGAVATAAQGVPIMGTLSRDL